MSKSHLKTNNHQQPCLPSFILEAISLSLQTQRSLSSPKRGKRAIDNGKANDSKISKSQQEEKINRLLKHFECKNMPRISLFGYVQRIGELGEFSLDVLIYALCLIKRAFKILKPSDKNCVYKLYGVCVFVANKMVNEVDLWKIVDFANLIGANDREEMRKMESVLVGRVLDFRVWVREAELLEARQQVFDNLRAC